MEQLSIAIRYADQLSHVTKKFLGLVHCSRGLLGEAISTDILAWLDTKGLDIQFCRSKRFDGAGNMAGKIKGFASRIQSCYPIAIYGHCGSHLLNVAIASSCSIQEVCSMLEHFREKTQFFTLHRNTMISFVARLLS